MPLLVRLADQMTGLELPATLVLQNRSLRLLSVGARVRGLVLATVEIYALGVMVEDSQKAKDKLKAALAADGEGANFNRR